MIPLNKTTNSVFFFKNFNVALMLEAFFLKKWKKLEFKPTNCKNYSKLPLNIIFIVTHCQFRKRPLKILKNCFQAIFLKQFCQLPIAKEIFS